MSNQPKQGQSAPGQIDQGQRRDDQSATGGRSQSEMTTSPNKSKQGDKDLRAGTEGMASGVRHDSNQGDQQNVGRPEDEQ